MRSANQDITTIQQLQKLSTAELHGKLDDITTLQQGIAHTSPLGLKIAFYRFRISMFTKHKLNRPENHRLAEALYGTDPFENIKLLNYVKFFASTFIVSYILMPIYWRLFALGVSLFCIVISDVLYPQIFANRYFLTALELTSRLLPAFRGPVIPIIPYIFDFLSDNRCNHYMGALSSVCRALLHDILKPTPPFADYLLVESIWWFISACITRTAIAKSEKLYNKDLRKIQTLQTELIEEQSNQLGSQAELIDLPTQNLLILLGITTQRYNSLVLEYAITKLELTVEKGRNAPLQKRVTELYNILTPEQKLEYIRQGSTPSHQV